MNVVLLALLLVTPRPSADGQPSGDRRVVILSPSKDDRRVALTREAIEFWNQTFLDLKLRPRLIPADVIVDSPMTRTLETYARQVAMRAEGQSPPGTGPR